MTIHVTPIPKLTAFATPTVTIAASPSAGTADTVIRSDSTIAGVALITSVNDSITRFNGTAGQLQGYTSNSPTIADNGVISTPGQPAFTVYMATTVANVTGDATSYPIVWGASLFDQGSNVSGGVFTAPVTGRYRLSCMLALGGVAGGHDDAKFSIVTTGTSNEYVQYFKPDSIIPGTTPYVCAVLTAVATMAATNTATVYIQVRGGAKTVDVIGSGDLQSSFSGELIA
jgi:hypothetical protein